MIFKVANRDTKSDNGKGVRIWTLLNNFTHLVDRSSVVFKLLSHHDSPKLCKFKQVNLFMKCELFTHVFQALLEKEKRRKEAHEWGNQGWRKCLASFSTISSSTQLPWIRSAQSVFGKRKQWFFKAILKCVLSPATSVKGGPGLEQTWGKFNPWTLHSGWGWAAGNKLPLQNQASLQAFLIWGKHFN